LKWASTDSAETSISGIGDVSAQGERAVTPTRNTTYVLTAKGPGGESTQSITVDVNTQPAATITVSQPELRYHKVGDRVVQQDSATLQWSASNANSAKIEPFDSNSLSGSRTVNADPKQTTTGPVNENVTYTVTATNACGGSVTKTATLHVVGSIDPPPAINLASLFYPTAYPTKHHPKSGLLASEQSTLATAATKFKTYSLYDEKASLVIVGHADVRGPENYNHALSARRAALAKDYLVAHGIPADKIRTQADGKDKQLDSKTVQALEAKDNGKPTQWMMSHRKATWLAYNRRADIVLEPSGQQSTEAYPSQSSDAKLLWQRPIPNLKQVERASEMSASVQQASAKHPGN